MDGLALGVTGPTVYNWCHELGIDIDEYRALAVPMIAVWLFLFGWSLWGPV